MVRTDDSAARAANWRTVLAVDAALGIVVSIVGVVLAVVVNAAVGFAVVALGAAYTALVGSRARRWARIRRESGL
jgi:hypothetical protein